MLLNQNGKSKSRSKNKKVTTDDAKYFPAKYFYNDLDNEDEYYLKVSPSEDNRFVRKDSVDNG